MNTLILRTDRVWNTFQRDSKKLESAKALKRWVTNDVLPSIHKTGRYDYCIDHKYNNTLTFKIENEIDLHVKVTSFLKKRYPHSLHCHIS